MVFKLFFQRDRRHRRVKLQYDDLGLMSRITTDDHGRPGPSSLLQKQGCAAFVHVTVMPDTQRDGMGILVY
jgi:hypothetical protein